jgi:type IV pilus biogenesis protein CpaD/CtpE
MRLRVRSEAWVTVVALVAGLALAAGCGDNDNRGRGPRPTRTPTPIVAVTPTTTPTPPPGAEMTTVAFALSASESINAASFDAAFDTALGSFTGCSISSGDGLQANTNEAGRVRLAITAADAIALSLPATITCPFDGAIAAGDLTIENKIVAVLDEDGIAVGGDPDLLTIDITATPS